MKKIIVIMALFLTLPVLSSAQNKARSTTKRNVTRTTQRVGTKKATQPSSGQSASSNDSKFEKGSMSRHNHADILVFGPNGEGGKVLTKGHANYVFELYSHPLDPGLKTAILTVDVDWKALGADDNQPIDWSWSGRGVNAKVDNNKDYIYILDGSVGAAGIGSVEGNEVIFLAGESPNQLTGLRQGMLLDDLARYIQKEIPGTRVVVTDKVVKGLTQYLLLSYGERKVYEVTGDYHYSIHNNEPYFSFWFDKNKKLVKWFKLKNGRY
jgi:hypothetical protein